MTLHIVLHVTAMKSLTCLNEEALSGSNKAAKLAVSARKTFTAPKRVSLSRYFFFNTIRTILGSAS